MHGRRLLSIGGAAAVTLALAVGATAGTTHRAAATLTIWCWTPTDDALKLADAAFTKAHPDVELNYVQIKPADVYQKLQLAAAAGLPFGAAVWIVADEIGVPLAGLSKPPTEYPLRDHASAFAAHLVFGVTTEGVRRLVLGVLGRA